MCRLESSAGITPAAVAAGDDRALCLVHRWDSLHGTQHSGAPQAAAFRCASTPAWLTLGLDHQLHLLFLLHGGGSCREVRPGDRGAHEGGRCWQREALSLQAACLLEGCLPDRCGCGDAAGMLPPLR